MKVKVWEAFEEDWVVMWKNMAAHNNKKHFLAHNSRFYNEEKNCDSPWT